MFQPSATAVPTRWICLLIISVLLLVHANTLRGAGYRNAGFVALTIVANETATDRLSDSTSRTIDWLGSVHAAFPSDNRMVYALALARWFRGDTEATRSTIEVYLRDVPDDLIGRFVLGSVAYETGDRATAFETWTALAAAPTFIRRASDELLAGNLSAAQQLLDHAIELDIASYSTAYRLAEQYSLLAAGLATIGDDARLHLACQSGSKAFQSAVDAEPGLGFVRINYGSFLRRCQHYREAIAQFQWVADSSAATTRAWAQHEIGVTYFTMNLGTEATHYFEQAVNSDPQNGLYRLSLAKAYLNSARKIEAQEQLWQILAGPDSQWKNSAESILKEIE